MPTQQHVQECLLQDSYLLYKDPLEFLIIIEEVQTRVSYVEECYQVFLFIIQWINQSQDGTVQAWVQVASVIWKRDTKEIKKKRGQVGMAMNQQFGRTISILIRLDFSALTFSQLINYSIFRCCFRLNIQAVRCTIEPCLFSRNA